MTSPDSKTTETPLTFGWARQSGEMDQLRKVLETKVLKKRRRSRRITAGTVGALLVAALAFWAVPFFAQTDTIATVPAHRQALALADGSSVDLNAQTCVHTDFRYGRRIVRLTRGEAYFSVAKDPAHPFLVETPAGTVRVTGTKFDVRVTESREAEITLLEGSVEIARPGESSPPVHLAQGQQFDSSLAEPRTLSALQLDNVVSWRSGRLALNGLTLEAAAGRFAAYHGKAITVSPSLAGLLPGGSVSLDDLPGFFEFLRQAFPVTVESRPDGSYAVVARP